MKLCLGSIVLLFSVLAGSNAQDTNETVANETEIDLSMLGSPSWNRLRPGWGLTVNDQCLYEFVFQFEHDDTLPIGSQNFENECTFKDPTTKGPLIADDDLPYLEPRKFWEQFPDYVWATLGFNHLSIEWYPCGHRPRGYSKAQYGFSFFRVTPEFRAMAMTCDLHDDEEVIVPGEEVCIYQQESINGMGFNIVPSHILDRNNVANMPASFNRPQLGNGPVPHVGLRSWDQDNIPKTPGQWNDYTPVFMSSYAGDLAMWHAKAPYSRLSGSQDRFTSNNYRYFEPTIDTLPDTHSWSYDAQSGMIQFTMVGKAGLCRGDYEKAQAASGGGQIFPNWDDFFSGGNGNGNGNGGSGSGSGLGNGDDDDNNKKSGVSQTSRSSSLFLTGVASLLLWARL
jgi:hypothetical protein